MRYFYRKILSVDFWIIWSKIDILRTAFWTILFPRHIVVAAVRGQVANITKYFIKARGYLQSCEPFRFQ